ncbi:MAG: Rrf2 family transcriptional regulator [Bacteroidales bacterium]|nr:Rrf2 family transcriptional regulator [Bacteroidales bacterium]
MAKLFNISEATIIAFHSLAMMDNNELVSAEKVATNTFASKNHVLKVLNHLVRQDYIRSIRGPKGGYMLNKMPENIFLLDVFELMEGPILPSPCGLTMDQCPFKKCVFGDITFQLTEMFVEFIKEKTVKDISEINLKGIEV